MVNLLLLVWQHAKKLAQLETYQLIRFYFKFDLHVHLKMLSSAFPSTGLLTFITPRNLCQSAPLPAGVSGSIYLAFICAQPIFHWTTRMRPVYGCRGILTLGKSANWPYHNGIMAWMEFQVNADAVLVKVHFNRTQPRLPKAHPEGGNIMQKLHVIIL